MAVIIGSTRPSRTCPDIARSVLDTAQVGSPVHPGLIDRADVHLPFLDEPLRPALGMYQYEHTRTWGDKPTSDVWRPCAR
ncbi:hypothetical protein DT076_01845 [Desertihabitans brevis]|uniref:NADPH-dependent FMN reductase-like domain-containing protein n=1 Tax=Desertihabitans brevis TaxID=2268447 RepID=A0A367YZG7_9ACTN|nr:hypothetical protein [Desertihabitans brevis]RCK71218.1 hypothetical protein DT076_01845 [Desertihabitans brevis]